MNANPRKALRALKNELKARPLTNADLIVICNIMCEILDHIDDGKIESKGKTNGTNGNGKSILEHYSH